MVKRKRKIELELVKETKDNFIFEFPQNLKIKFEVVDGF